MLKILDKDQTVNKTQDPISAAILFTLATISALRGDVELMYTDYRSTRVFRVDFAKSGAYFLSRTVNGVNFLYTPLPHILPSTFYDINHEVEFPSLVHIGPIVLVKNAVVASAIDLWSKIGSRGGIRRMIGMKNQDVVASTLCGITAKAEAVYPSDMTCEHEMIVEKKLVEPFNGRTIAFELTVKTPMKKPIIGVTDRIRIKVDNEKLIDAKFSKPFVVDLPGSVVTTLLYWSHVKYMLERII